MKGPLWRIRLPERTTLTLFRRSSPGALFREQVATRLTVNSGLSCRLNAFEVMGVMSDIDLLHKCSNRDYGKKLSWVKGPSLHRELLIIKRRKKNKELEGVSKLLAASVLWMWLRKCPLQIRVFLHSSNMWAKKPKKTWSSEKTSHFWTLHKL